MRRKEKQNPKTCCLIVLNFPENYKFQDAYKF